HQAGLGRISAQLPQLAGGTVEEPVVSAGIGAPYAVSIGEDQDPLVVLRPIEPRDLQRLFCACRRELCGRDQDLAVFARRGVVLYKVTPGAAAGRWFRRNVGLPTVKPAWWRRKTLAEFT